jgi:hypothetical protein
VSRAPALPPACLLAVLALSVLAGFPLAALAQSARVSVRAGVEQTSGDYGGSDTLTDRYVPVSVLYQRRQLDFRLTVPYVEVELTGLAGNATTTETGLGDVVLALTRVDAFRSANGRTAVDVTGKVKLGTADEVRGLGTGETDLALVADVYRETGDATLVASVGYKARGEPPGVTLDDGWLGTLGALYRFSPATTGGVFLDYRQSSVPELEAIRELALVLSHRIGTPWRIQGYVARGLSDTSLDWGAGVSLRRNLGLADRRIRRDSTD